MLSYLSEKVWLTLYLGIEIDSFLMFYQHIDKMCNKTNQRAAIILKSRNPDLLVKSFITYVKPILEYAITYGLI